MEANCFWNNVNEVIKRNKTKQEHICQLTGISINTLRGWISKNIFPRADEAVKIARALGTTVEYLITGEEPAENTKYEELKEALEKLIQQN